MPAVMPRETQLVPLPMFSDNYLWVLRSPTGRLLAVDVGDYAALARHLAASGDRLATVFVTHHHPDHVGGLPELRERHPEVVVYGPAGITGVTEVLHGDETLSLGDLGDWHVLDTPGHTVRHLSFHAPAQRLLFCGDTLFSAGCGRVLGGDIRELYRSLRRLAALSPDTRVCPAHEYTLANIAFARAADPENTDLQHYENDCRRLRDAGLPTLPSTLALENRINPFLRCDDPALRARLPVAAPPEPEHVFQALRGWKDVWRG